MSVDSLILPTRSTRCSALIRCVSWSEEFHPGSEWVRDCLWRTKTIFLRARTTTKSFQSGALLEKLPSPWLMDWWTVRVLFIVQKSTQNHGATNVHCGSWWMQLDSRLTLRNLKNWNIKYFHLSSSSRFIFSSFSQPSSSRPFSFIRQRVSEWLQKWMMCFELGSCTILLHPPLLFPFLSMWLAIRTKLVLVSPSTRHCCVLRYADFIVGQ